MRTVGHGGRLRIEAVHAPDRDVALEVYTAQERSALLAEVLERRVDVVAVARRDAGPAR